MTTTTDARAAVDGFAETVFAAVLGAQQVQAIDLGDRLGWYRALAEGGPLTSGELAERTGSAERYAREWLEHQAVCGYVTVDDPAAEPGERRFTLPAAHAAVLVDRDDVAHMAPIARFVSGAGALLDRIEHAYRTGGGLGWDEMGDGQRRAQADANRPLFLHRLGQELLPAAPEVHERLRSSRRIADVGCGFGWSAIGLARTYPAATIDGYDIDEPSILAARRNAEDLGLADRVRFHVADGATAAATAGGVYDAVFAFECVHDMPDPVAVLVAMRRMAAADGVVVVMDERTEDRFTAPAGEVEQLLYGYSLTCCLVDGLAHEASVATGTVMRADTFRSYAHDAGFESVAVLPIEDDFFRFYRLS